MTTFPKASPVPLFPLHFVSTSCSSPPSGRARGLEGIKPSLPWHKPHSLVQFGGLDDDHQHSRIALTVALQTQSNRRSSLLTSALILRAEIKSFGKIYIYIYIY